MPSDWLSTSSFEDSVYNYTDPTPRFEALIPRSVEHGIELWKSGVFVATCRSDYKGPSVGSEWEAIIQFVAIESMKINSCKSERSAIASQFSAIFSDLFSGDCEYYRYKYEDPLGLARYPVATVICCAVLQVLSTPRKSVMQRVGLDIVYAASGVTDRLTKSWTVGGDLNYFARRGIPKEYYFDKLAGIEYNEVYNSQVFKPLPGLYFLAKEGM